MSPLGIILVLWRSEPYIDLLLHSLQEQTFTDFDLFVFDNGSTEAVKKVQKVFPYASIFGKGHNFGFAHANNVLIRKSKNPYILLLNHDIILHPQCLEVLMKVTESNLSFGSLAPRLYKAQWNETGEVVKTNIFDSTGLCIQKNRHVADRDANQYDIGQRQMIQEVFGATGALALFSKQALDKVMYQNEYFDESFISYKEDIDLAWRLQNAGYPCYYIPHSRAWHFRGMATTQEQSFQEIQKDRQKRNPFLRTYSYANHLSLLLINENIRQWIWDSPFILWYELKKILYFSVYERQTLRGFVIFVKRLPFLLKKRRYLRKLISQGRNIAKFF